MKFKWENDLPFISVKLVISGSTIELNHALIDTGAASSLFNVDKVFKNGITIKDTDTICKMVGIGGTEHVIQRKISSVLIANTNVAAPTVQFGSMDYGFDIDGIIGSDILREMSAVIDFDEDSIISKK
jgi:predicted aspartyl protease